MLFETLYSTLNTSYTTDVDTHIKKQKKAWKQNEVKISGTKASLITVVFHSSFGKMRMNYSSVMPVY